MEKAGFYILYGLSWIITLLPLRLLYFLSDILFLFLYYFPSYRKNIVAENLRNSFPGKSDDELKEISRKFYRHLADLFIETLKLVNMSNKQLQKRMTVSNPELIESLYDKGRDVVVVHSHYNNWEWLGVSFPLYTIYNTLSVYKPIQNKVLDRFMKKLRTRNNAGLAPMNQVVRRIVENQGRNIRTLYGFIADQTPARTLIEYYTDFLNQETPVFLGIEKIATRYDMAVVFFNVRKVKRGYYDVKVELLFENTRGLPRYSVTNSHVKRLDEVIRQRPEHWIWTHRRWKYKKEGSNE